MPQKLAHFFLINGAPLPAIDLCAVRLWLAAIGTVCFLEQRSLNSGLRREEGPAATIPGYFPPPGGWADLPSAQEYQILPVSPELGLAW
jgi:hypothetical protein